MEDFPTDSVPARRPVRNAFAIAGVIASLLAPFGTLAGIFIGALYIYRHAGGNPFRQPLYLALPLLFIPAGIVCGILALILTRRRENKARWWLALTGMGLNVGFGLLLVGLCLGAPFIMRHMLRADGAAYPRTPQARLDKALKTLNDSDSDKSKFYALDDAAKQSFETGRAEDAEKYAKELLDQAANYPADWNYGNAIQDGNQVLGRLALRAGRLEEAKQYLIESGKSKGSPQMDSFGPNMSLARDLLGKGEKETVLEYFKLCRVFWTNDHGKLDEWTSEVSDGKTPNFGANLVY